MKTMMHSSTTTSRSRYISRKLFSKGQRNTSGKCTFIRSKPTTPSCRHKSTGSTNNSSNSSNSGGSGSNNANNTVTITAQDVQNIQKELHSLQQTIKEGRLQSYQVESLTRTLTARTAKLEDRLQTISEHVSRIGSIEQLLNNTRDFLHHTPAIRVLVDNLETVLHRSRPFVQNYKSAIGAIAVTMAIIWRYRSNLVYERTSEEVADLARLTLEQHSLRRSIQETLQTVAHNPQTLETLTELVQKLITHEQTQQELVNLLVHAVNTEEVQTALLDLLQVVFKDEHLQQLTGEFLLKGLDMDNVKAMLDEQTAQLVRDTVDDDSVQQATAVGIQRSLWYAVLPSYLWRFMEKKKPTTKEENRPAEESSAGNTDDDSHDEKSPEGHESLPSQ